jgi:Flp pilus assembly protein TadB
MLNRESGDAIFVPEKDLEKATLLIEEYLQSVPKESGDDEWKRELATKRLRGNLAATWVFSLGSAGVGLGVMIEASGVPAKLSGLVFIVLAIVFFWSFREQRRRDQEIVSQSKRKPE